MKVTAVVIMATVFPGCGGRARRFAPAKRHSSCHQQRHQYQAWGRVADVQVETPKLEATTVERNGDRLFAIDRLNGRVIVVGVLNNYQEVDSDHYTAEVSITTGPSIINGIYAPSVRRYYVGVPQHGNTDDQILVYGIQ